MAADKSLIFGFLILFANLPSRASCAVVKRSDDVSVESLQLLVQQQASVITTLQASQAAMQHSMTSFQGDMTSMQTKINTLENKVATLSKAVAFTAMFSKDNSDAGIPLTPPSNLVFDHVITNAGSGYNPATGIFTSPLAGYYAFSIVMMEPNSNNHPNLLLSLVKNGHVFDQAHAANVPADPNEQGSTHSVIHLAAGDQVWARLDVGDGVRGSWWTVFTGYLVHTE